MTEPARSSADQQIQARQLALQKKVQQTVKIGAGAIAVLLVVYLASQFFKSDSGLTADIEAVSGGAEVRLTSIELEEFRNRFRQLLTQFESDQQSILDNSDIANWQPDRINGLIQQKDKALAEFAKSSFQTATQTLEKLVNDAEILEQDWRDAYTQKLAESKQFLQQEKINQARFAFSEAVKIMPANPDGKVLEQKLAGYESIAIVRQAYKVAQVENNIGKQIQLLTELIALDPSLQEEQQELSRLRGLQRDKQHAEIVLNANQALDNGRLTEARGLYEQAKALKPNDTATRNLLSRLQQDANETNLSNSLAQVEGLVEQQRWQEALSLSTQYAQTFPGQTRFSDVQQQAQRIVQAQKRVLQFTARPERLADDGLRSTAVNTLQDALPLAVYSKPLAESLGKLAKAIDAYATPIDVTIMSDEKSYILVLGVGHVGEVKQKQIQLTPGDYTLEARREGYKTKRLQINVSSGLDNQFYLVNDEKI